ncbi:protein of unknown function [Magnetospirillum sp. XM-1]|nr:protein of unknown function [Magnetospirillum sp. XM-1]
MRALHTIAGIILFHNLLFGIFR